MIKTRFDIDEVQQKFKEKKIFIKREYDQFLLSKRKDSELQIQLYDELKSQIAEIKEEITQKRYMIETYERYMYE